MGNIQNRSHSTNYCSLSSFPNLLVVQVRIAYGDVQRICRNRIVWEEEELVEAVRAFQSRWRMLRYCDGEKVEKRGKEIVIETDIPIYSRAGVGVAIIPTSSSHHLNDFSCISTPPLFFYIFFYLFSQEG